MKHIAFSLLMVIAVGSTQLASAKPNCKDLPTDGELAAKLNQAATSNTLGGIFGGHRMWGAVVNRNGELCSSATTTADATQVWPGSQAIAKSKAYTANAFSLDYGTGGFALSTAMLYTLTQPGHSLWSLGQSNLFDTKFLAPPQGQNGNNADIPGGLIFFGGGVALYKDGKIVGALGVSGDTSCADHESAKATRDLLGLNPPVANGGKLADDIVYSSSVFAHPVCLNTWKNNAFVGNEAPATYPPAP